MINTTIHSQPEISMNNISDKTIDISFLLKETISDTKTESVLPEVVKIIGRSFYGFWEVNK